LACQEVEIKSFMAEGNTLGELAESILESFLGLLQFALVEELVSTFGEATIGARAGGKGESEK